MTYTVNESAILNSLKRYLFDNNIKKFTEVQENVIPLIFKNKNVFCESPTGTGKTYSFLLPLITKIIESEDKSNAIIIVPTKILARQINSILKDIVKYIGDLSYSTIIDVNKVNDLNERQIIVCTPLIFSEILKAKPNLLSNLKWMIIDEIDMIYKFGDLPLCRNVYLSLKQKPNLFMFSATFPINMQNYIKKNFPIEVSNIVIKQKNQIIHNSIEANNTKQKFNDLLKLLNESNFNPYFCIIFCNTAIEANNLYKKLINNSIDNIALITSEINERQKNRIYKNILNNNYVYLVATDSLSRGIDIKGTSHIINYSIPKEYEYFKHRIGRTNRINSEGKIYTFYTHDQKNELNRILSRMPYIINKRLKV